MEWMVGMRCVSFPYGKIECYDRAPKSRFLQNVWGYALGRWLLVLEILGNVDRIRGELRGFVSM